MSLRPHRLWLALLALAVIIIAGSGPVLDLGRGEALHNLAEVKSARVKAEQNLKLLRDNVADARKLNGQIDRVSAEQVLAPTDRLKAAEMLERESNTAGIAHFTYTLAPEEHRAVNVGGETQDLASSAVTLAGDARDDVSVYGFIERTRRLLSGRVQVQKLTITRNGGLNAPLAPISNVHFEAAFEWLSNGAVQTLAGGP